MSWTDEEIDKLYRDSAEGMTFEYKESFWDDFNASLPEGGVSAIPQAEPIHEVDEMYKQEASGLSFQYKDAYWHEMAGMLPRRRPDILWFATAIAFLGLFSTSLVMNQAPVLNAETPAFATNFEPPSQSIDLVEAHRSVVSKEDVEGSKNKVSDDLVEASSMRLSAESKSNATSSSSPGTIINAGETGVISQTVSPVHSAPNGNLVTGVDSPSGANATELPFDLVNTEDQREGQVVDFDLEVVSQLEVNSPELIDQNTERAVWVNPYAPPRAYSKFYAQALGGMSQSLISPSEALSSSYGLGVGLLVRKGNLAFDFGVNGVVNNYSDLKLTRTGKVYGFGSDLARTDVQYHNLYSLEGNLAFGYQVKRHRFNLGVRPSVVVSSKVRVREHSEANGSSPTKPKTEVSDVYGPLDGLYLLGVKPTVGYAFEISPQWTVGANFGVQLMQSVNEDYLEGINNRLPIDGQIYLRKSFGGKK